MSPEVDIEELVASLEQILPARYFSGVEAAYIGDFPELEDRKALFAAFEACRLLLVPCLKLVLCGQKPQIQVSINSPNFVSS